jgi:hypothetical protein
MSEEFKVCTICKDKKSLDDFNKKKLSKDGRQNLCKLCNLENGKKHYLLNTEKVKQRIYNRKETLKPLIQDFIVSHLKNGCVDCGEKDLIVLDFDHLENKECSISSMINDCASLDKIALEISKCVVRCANCHRRKTAKDFGWWRLGR